MISHSDMMGIIATEAIEGDGKPDLGHAAPHRAPLSRFPTLERMVYIVEAAISERPLNCRQLANEMDCSMRTIKREIEFLRDRLGLPIEHDPVIGAYVLRGHIRPGLAVVIAAAKDRLRLRRHNPHFAFPA